MYPESQYTNNNIYVKVDKSSHKGGNKLKYKTNSPEQLRLKCKV